MDDAAIIEAMARSMLECRGQTYVANPFERDEDAHNSALEAQDDARTILAAITPMIQAREAKARRAALEEAAKACDNSFWAWDVKFWLKSTKKEISAASARACAKIIRALIAKETA